MRSGGTGFQIENKYGDKFIVTNEHVCDGDSVKYVQNMHGETRMLQVIKKSKKHDLCVLKPWNNESSLKTGKAKRFDKVYVVGYPGLRPLTFQSGMFLKKDELIRLATECEGKVTILELLTGCSKTFTAVYFNAPIYPGNSGSPLVNVYGRVIGVVFAGIPTAPNAGYAVPLEELEEFINNL
jgi:S1-C subfamily serine protease